MSTSINEPIEQFWIQLGPMLTFVIPWLGRNELSELQDNLDTVANTLDVAESLTGEMLARSAHWPKQLNLKGTDVSFIGAHIGNMAALKGFLQRLDEEICDLNRMRASGERDIDFAATPSHLPEAPGGEENDKAR